MKTNREIRQEARKLAKGKWFWRIFSTGLLLYLITALVTILLTSAYEDMQIQTWMDFLVAKAKAWQSGLDYSVPSTRLAWQMTGASFFQQFIACIFGAIVLFGGATVLLKAMRNEEKCWLVDSFGGFRRPLEVAWLLVLMNAKVFLWSLLFVFPGWIAIYRYRQAWFLKSDNPDWSAARCIAESGRMMRGHKAQAFALDCSYIGWLLLGWMMLLGGALMGASEAANGSMVLSAISGVVGLVGLYFFAYVIIYFLAGRTVFYREVSALRPAPSESPNEQT